MKATTIIATTVLLLGVTQLQAQTEAPMPGNGAPTGGVGPGTSNGRPDGSPTPGGPPEEKAAGRNKPKRAGTEGSQSGAKPGSPVPDPNPNTPGTSGKPTAGSSDTQSGRKKGDPDPAHDYGPGKSETPKPR